MLKKSIKVKVNFDEDEPENLNAYNPFNRGVMEFDDYNYEAYNQHILLEDPKHIDSDEQGSKVPKVEASLPPTSPVAKGKPDLDPAFSEKNLTNSVTDEYKHPLVTIEPSEMELEKAKQERELKEKADQEAAAAKALEDAKKKKKSSKISSRDFSDDEDKTNGEGEGEGEGENEKSADAADDAELSDEEGGEYDYRVFYKKDEIVWTKLRQDTDYFEEIVRMK